MLNEGEWNGEQVISRQWARRIASVVTPLEEMNPSTRREGYFGYGYMWWIFDGPRVSGPFEGAYTGRGAVGQWISVFPAIDLVIAHKTRSAYGRSTSWRSWQRLVELLLEAHGVEMGGPPPWQPVPAAGRDQRVSRDRYRGSRMIRRTLSPGLTVTRLVVNRLPARISIRI